MLPRRAKRVFINVQINSEARAWKWLAVTGLIAGVLALALGTANYWLSPLLSERLSAVAHQRFGNELQFRRLSVSLFPHVSVIADEVAFRQHGRTDVPPLVIMSRVHVSAGLAELIGPYRRAHRMVIEGLRITVPPRDANVSRTASQKPAAGDHLIADELIANDSVVTILPGVPGKNPLVFNIYKLVLTPAAQDAMHYRAQLHNAKPPGLIESDGEFGPWSSDDPGGMPLSGSYRFSHADLSVFNGIMGTLSSTGRFGGNLETIHAEGNTDTPDFALRDAGHPVHLVAHYQAVIDGTNGETLLQPVEAQFRHTHITCRGGVLQEPGQKGKTVDLQGSVQNGRLEDVLYLATKSTQPMTGSLSFDSKIIIPPGDIDVVRKLYLDGHAAVREVLFTNPEVQRTVNELSNRASGQPKAPDTQRAFSTINARFIMDQGAIQFPALSFGIPGAEISMTGTYGILNEAINFQGHASTVAKPSQMTTGVKSVLLKAVDPFVKKGTAGAVIPVHITGTREHPIFGL